MPHHDVVRLDIAVHNARFMRGGERERSLAGYIEQLLDGEWTLAGKLPQCFAGDKFRCHEADSPILIGFIDRKNVGMVEQ